jgi:AcrR family transcriptional regulator
MAQKSKKDHIVSIAMPLFLRNGFKGTSIDMVVKKSSVSKPTVYNHFPDKAALMLAVIEHWVAANKPNLPGQIDADGFASLIDSKWLSEDAIGFYALIIGEGWRFPMGKQIFWKQFDEIWRKALAYVGRRATDFTQESLDLMLDQQLLARLKQR